MNTQQQSEIHRKLRREEQLRDLRDGRKRRAVTQPDKRKKSSKNACRKGNW